MRKTPTHRQLERLADMNANVDLTGMSTDKEGFLVDIRKWNNQIAIQLALNEEIELTPAHWEVLEVLRNFYHETEVSPAMRPFVKLVRESLGQSMGNSIYLMGLFGDSPAKMAAKIAGLPRPTNCL